MSFKEKAARKCGILTDQVRLPASASESEVFYSRTNHPEIDLIAFYSRVPQSCCVCYVLMLSDIIGSCGGCGCSLFVRPCSDVDGFLKVVAAVSAIDKNPDVDGVLVQLPLPSHMCTATVLRYERENQMKSIHAQLSLCLSRSLFDYAIPSHFN